MNACRQRKLADVRRDDPNYLTNHHFTMTESKTLVSKAPVNSPTRSSRIGSPELDRILTINGGSSSLKFAVYERNHDTSCLVSGRVDRIGLNDARWVVNWSGGGHNEDRPVDAPDQTSAVRLVIDWLEQVVGFANIAAVGHRIVHGGGRYYQPQRVTAQVIDDLRKISMYDPDHLPGELDLIRVLQCFDPDLPQMVCFDTAFHHNMPRVAQIVPIPRRFDDAGVRRFGFHGLSYAYLMGEMARVAGLEEAGGRVILAHLGAGASLAAVNGGQSIDTSMGFTPASGLVMGTRTGDLDPGLVRFLSHSAGMTTDLFDNLVNHESGLLGISQTSSDVRELLERQKDDVRAAEAIEVFCYQAKKWIGAYAAALGGLDTLVFSGGIGENAPEIRRRICTGLAFLGIDLDDGRNESSALLISTDNGPVKVRVIPTDEALMIARAVARLMPRSS
jgi:acetate kinase